MSTISRARLTMAAMIFGAVASGVVVACTTAETTPPPPPLADGGDAGRDADKLPTTEEDSGTPTVDAAADADTGVDTPGTRVEVGDTAEVTIESFYAHGLFFTNVRRISGTGTMPDACVVHSRDIAATPVDAGALTISTEFAGPDKPPGPVTVLPATVGVIPNTYEVELPEPQQFFPYPGASPTASFQVAAGWKRGATSYEVKVPPATREAIAITEPVAPDGGSLRRNWSQPPRVTWAAQPDAGGPTGQKVYLRLLAIGDQRLVSMHCFWPLEQNIGEVSAAMYAAFRKEAELGKPGAVDGYIRITVGGQGASPSGGEVVTTDEKFNGISLTTSFGAEKQMRFEP